MRLCALSRWALVLSLACFGASAKADPTGQAASSVVLVPDTAPAWAALPDMNSPLSGGVSGDGTDASPKSQAGVHPEFLLAEARIGKTFEVDQGGLRLGSYLQDIPTNVEWGATMDAFKASGAYAVGQIALFPNERDPQRRVLFSAGGSFSLTWHLNDGTTSVVTYTVRNLASERPHRIFWTSYPYNAPGVNMRGKFIKLFGRPSIVQPQYAVDSRTQVSNVVRGVYLDTSSMTLQAVARVTGDGTADGPLGQFVVAYYDAGDYRNVIGVTVAEACGPDVTTLSAHVGERLRPYGDGYDVKGLRAYVEKGATQVDGDLASPYLEVFSAQSKYNEKNGAVYAVAPTDGSASADGKPSPSRAHIYWESPDLQDVLWPFEEDFYLISWNPDDPKMVVTDDPSKPGTDIFLPMRYAMSLCEYRKPSDCVRIPSNNVVSVTKPGRFMLQLTFDDDVRYLPIQAYARGDANVTVTNSILARVGEALAPPSVTDTSDAVTDEVAWLDGTVPGYLYEHESERIWNPHLYKAPKFESGIDTVVSDDVDPYERLSSSICLVEATSPGKSVEVWWYRKVQWAAADVLPTPVSIPSVACRYTSKWPEKNLVHEIALVSQKGSGGASLKSTGASYRLLAKDNGAGRTDGPYGVDAEKGLAIGAWFNAGPSYDGDAKVAPTAGQLMQFGLGSYAFRLLATGVTPTTAALRLDYRTPGGEKTKVIGDMPRDTWCRLVVSVAAFTNGNPTVDVYLEGCTNVVSFALPMESANEVSSLTLTNYCVGASMGETNGVCGWAVGGFTAWARAMTTNEFVELGTEDGLKNDLSKERLFRYDFAGFVNAYGWPVESGDDSYCIDSLWNESWVRVYGGRIERISPGAPTISYGHLPVSDGCQPRVYRQTSSELPGRRLNLEHAFTTLNESGTEPLGIVWALRNDLRDADRTNAYVLAEYASDGFGRMAVFRVVESNNLYRTTLSETEVATRLVPPKPLSQLDDYWNEKTYYDNYAAPTTNDADTAVLFRDRKQNDWARRDGRFDAHYFYRARDDFDAPGLSKPLFGLSLPWRCAGKPDTWETDLLGEPKNLAPWTWCAVWPKSPSVMQVAQTLTKPVNGLPEVWNMASCQVVYPKADRWQVIGNSPTGMLANVVDLIDPVTAQKAALAISQSFTEEYGFTLGNSGTTMLRQGKYYFTGLPPSISDRFYVDTSAVEAERMVLVGALVEPTTGNPYVRLNVLTTNETAMLKAICTLDAKSAAKKAWDRAVDGLAAKSVIRPGPDDPVANYALVANGNGSGWVVIAENNSTNTTMVKAGDPVDLKVICVTNTLYRGSVSAQTDSLNKLSELLTVQYNEAFGPAAMNFNFEWRRIEPVANGTVSDNKISWPKAKEGRDLTRFTLGQKGTTLAELVNAYWTVRYMPLPDTPAYYTCGGAWSEFAEQALAEGWVQRVLNAVTPFAQRVEDFYSNPSDISYTMLEQIGGPYVGDVALNNDNLSAVGLIELYQTIFNKAERMSLALANFDSDDASAAGVFKQLTLAATRLAELYQLLGGEAYADAKNPLIGQGLGTGLGDLAALPSSTFCFQNQVRTLLDEELCLLRGRTMATASPNMTTKPCFNRLYWNFTKGLTEGEAAYVNNYDIRGANGVITADCAAKQYPQGHGDAWGHYLSSLKAYYRLLRNRKFVWQAAMGEMNVAGTVVNEDYTDEQKFADSAVKLAQIGLDVVDLTARKAWKDNGGEVESGYFDGAKKTYGTKAPVTVEEGFGYGEWAARTALGGVYNWMVVNAMLPTNETPSQVYVDRGIAQITRPTATQLAELCDLVDAVQTKVNTLDAGLNPLGLSQNAVPMDIDPDALESKNSHFDQILERAEKALANCSKVLDYANVYGSRLRQIQNQESSEGTAAEIEEASYDKELIALYGTPYTGDIGTGKTYVQGYDGPDLYHYMYLDLAEYGLTKANLGDVTIKTKTYQWVTNGVTSTGSRIVKAVTKDLVSTEISYSYSALGIAVKPDGFGKRTTEGTIQAAGRAYLHARLSLENAKSTYESATGEYDRMLKYLTKKEESAVRKMSTLKAAKNLLTGAQLVYKYGAKAVTNTTDLIDLVRNNTTAVTEAVPATMGAGLAVIADPRSLVNAVATAQIIAQNVMKAASKKTLEKLQTVTDVYSDALSLLESNWSLVSDLAALREDFWSQMQSYESAMCNAYSAYAEAEAALAEADAAYRAEVAKGDRLQSQRLSARMRRSNTATAYRYADMFNRVQRNNALVKYSTAFDTAQRYVWQLAKVYDYETGLLSSDSLAGDAFLAEIVGSRQLGYPGVSTSSATDKGLYDIVNRMKENWAVLKGRLGVNNPAKTTTDFSLRYELFRIRPDAEGDEAWKAKLGQYWVEDVNSDPTFRRFCQPLEASEANALKEPGLIIPFKTSIYAAENFFGRTLQGGDSAFSSADYATKINAVGISFAGYDKLADLQSALGLKRTPYVYLVPTGRDYMRAPAGTSRKVLSWNVVDQVLPLPYAIGSTELDDEDWIATVSGLDGTTDSAAKIRRHAPFRMDGDTHSTRLVGRSVWNDQWLLVIPGVELNSDRAEGLRTFIKGVSDIKLKIRAYARQGN